MLLLTIWLDLSKVLICSSQSKALIAWPCLIYICVYLLNRYLVFCVFPNYLYLPLRYLVFSVWPNFFCLDLQLHYECWKRKGGQRARCAISLHCTTLICTVLHCIALDSTALHYPALPCIALNHTAIHCITRHMSALYITSPNWSAIFFTELLYTLLQWTAEFCPSL